MTNRKPKQQTLSLTWLQGRWWITQMQSQGNLTAASILASAHIDIDGDRFRSSMPQAVYAGQLVLDPTVVPATIDLVFTDGPNRGTRILGIARVQGDAWQLCLAAPGQPRPGQFTASAGSSNVLETLSRQPVSETNADTESQTRSISSGKTAAAAASPSAEDQVYDGEWQMCAGTIAGKALPADMVQSGRRIVRHGRVEVQVAGRVMVNTRAVLRHDATPTQIDYLPEPGDNAEPTQRGILRMLDGELEVCMAASGKPRPTGFVSTAHGGETLTRWRRISA